MDDLKIFKVKIKCNTCGETWEEDAFENPETGDTMLVDEDGGWICPNCDLDGDTEIEE